MSTKVEKLEHNMAELTVEVSAEDFDKAINEAYNKNKSKITLPGFRKGKAPRAMIERMYGVSFFYEDAANAAINESYGQAADESGLEIMSQPEIDVKQIEKGKAFIYTAKVAVKPEVTLGNYRGVEVSKSDVEVKEEEIDAEIKKEQDSNARTLLVEDRAAQKDDTVTMDFEGFVDNVPFEGGKGEGYPLTLGSNSFIPGFEDQLIGVKANEPVDVKVTFPEDYHAEELKGKEAVFKCMIHKIEAKEYPKLDDDFAKDVSEFDTMKEYREDIRKNLLSKKEEEAKSAKENAVVDKLIEEAQMDLPKPIIDSEVSQMVRDFASRIQQQGMTMEQYMQFTGSNEEKLLEQMRPQAEKRIKSRLVLEKIAEEEKIEISEDKINEEIDKMAKMYNMEADKLKELLGDYEKDQMKKDMAVQEAVTLVTEAAKEV